MSGRRNFLRSVSAGSAAYLTGCVTPMATGAPADGGAPCPTPVTPTPPALDYPPPAYFDQLSLDLDAATIGTPVALIDLDRMEANIDAIVAGIGPHRFRIVEKSLPSLDLLRLVTERAGQAGAESFLVLHLPFLGPLVAAFPQADVLLGKTHLTSAVERFFLDLAPSEHAQVAARVAFLADGPERLAELLALAMSLPGIVLRIAIEIDVGLRRSGLALVDGPTPTEGLTAMLDIFRDNTQIELVGLLGYDGHIAFTPSGDAEGVLREWSRSTEIYATFVAALQAYDDGSLFHPDLIFHTGGTSTFSLYSDPARPTPVNDVATGGGVLRPGEYPDYFLSALSPAIFVATPVLRDYDEPALPFLTPLLSDRVFAGRQGLTIYGGGWPASFTYPAIGPAPLSSGCGGAPPLVPNQGLVTADPALGIETGDWIYFHPLGSDVMFQFEHVLLVRGGRITTERVAPYPRRY